nr:CoA transferase [Nocardia mangyaensis]
MNHHKRPPEHRSADRRRAADVITRADIVLDNNRPGLLPELGIDLERLRDGDERPIWVSMPGFASTDPEFAGTPGWEILIGATCGMFTDTA